MNLLVCVMLLSFFDRCYTLTAFTARTTTRSATRLLASPSSSSSFENDDVDDSDFMASLQSRMNAIKENKLPLVVMDSMLPRQVLKITVNNPIFMDLVRERVSHETPYFGMMGMARLATGETVHLKNGVRVEIVGKPKVTERGLQLELKAGSRFRITGDVDNNVDGGWTEAKVEFQADDDDEKLERERSDRFQLARAMAKAQKLTPLVGQWISMARTKERESGQIEKLLGDLGDLPCSERPTDRAMWIGALINPIPAMGVALEIRPALLTAETAEERIDVALTGIKRSIQHMKGDPLL